MIEKHLDTNENSHPQDGVPLEKLHPNDEGQIEILFKKYNLGMVTMNTVFEKLSWYYDLGFSVGKYVDRANVLINKKLGKYDG